VDAKQVPGANGRLPDLEFELEWYGVDASNDLPQIEVEVSGFLDEAGQLSKRTERHRILPQHGKRFKVPAIQGAQAYRLAVRVTAAATASFLDALEQDNEYYLVPSRNEGASLVVVSDLSAAELGLTRMRGVRALRLSVDEYVAQGLPDDTRAVIFHRFVPKQIPGRVALALIMPPSVNALVSVVERALPAQVSAWRSDHALTRYVRFAGLILPRSLVMQVPSWGTEIFRTVDGVVMAAGELQGRRIVVMGVEPFPFEGARSPLMSVLLLNVISWISESGAVRGTEGIGESSSIVLSPHLPLGLSSEAARGATLLTTSARGEPLPVATHLGKNALMPGRTGIVYLPNAPQSERFYPINFVDPSESDLSLKSPILAPERAMNQGDARQGLPLERWLILLALTVLLVDWLYRVVRLVIRTRRSIIQVTHVY
jgi:hypothetical protein